MSLVKFINLFNVVENTCIMLKSDIAYFNRDQLIDFVSKNWHEVIKHIPTDKRRMYFKNRRTCELREIALNIVDA